MWTKRHKHVDKSKLAEHANVASCARRKRMKMQSQATPAARNEAGAGGRALPQGSASLVISLFR